MEAVGFTRAGDIAWDVATMRLGLIGALAGTMQDAPIIGIAAVTGETITGIRTMDIPGSVFTARAMAIHITEVGITDTAPVGTIRMDTIIILIPTDTHCI